MKIPRDCSSQKIPYATRADASADARVIEKKYRGRRDPYQCRRCGAWHLMTRKG